MVRRSGSTGSDLITPGVATRQSSDPDIEA
jgi:hypothetical protein